MFGFPRWIIFSSLVFSFLCCFTDLLVVLYLISWLLMFTQHQQSQLFIFYFIFEVLERFYLKSRTLTTCRVHRLGFLLFFNRWDSTWMTQVYTASMTAYASLGHQSHIPLFIVYFLFLMQSLFDSCHLFHFLCGYY